MSSTRAERRTMDFGGCDLLYTLLSITSILFQAPLKISKFSISTNNLAQLAPRLRTKAIPPSSQTHETLQIP